MRIKPNQAVERTASQPTGRVAGGGVSGGWLAFAHFYRSPKTMKLILALLLSIIPVLAHAKPMTGSVSSWEGKFALAQDSILIRIANMPPVMLWLYELKTGSAGTAIGFSAQNGDMILAPQAADKGIQPVYQSYAVTFTTNGDAEVVVMYSVQGEGGQSCVETYGYDGQRIRLISKSIYGGRHDPVWRKEQLGEPGGGPNSRPAGARGSP